jgi:hypothetical protein
VVGWNLEVQNPVAPICRKNQTKPFGPTAVAVEASRNVLLRATCEMNCSNQNNESCVAVLPRIRIRASLDRSMEMRWISESIAQTARVHHGSTSHSRAVAVHYMWWSVPEQLTTNRSKSSESCRGVGKLWKHDNARAGRRG